MGQMEVWLSILIAVLAAAVAGAAAFEVKLPAEGGVVLIDDQPPADCRLAGDFFRIITRKGGEVRGVMVDAYHLLMRYEQYGFLVLLALSYFGVMNGFITNAIIRVFAAMVNLIY